MGHLRGVAVPISTRLSISIALYFSLFNYLCGCFTFSAFDCLSTPSRHAMAVFLSHAPTQLIKIFFLFIRVLLIYEALRVKEAFREAHQYLLAPSSP